MLGLCKLLSSVTIRLFLMHDFHCHVQGSKIYRCLQSNLVWIRDILIEFMERFFSGNARSNSLNLLLKNRSAKTILLVV